MKLQRYLSIVVVTLLFISCNKSNLEISGFINGAFSDYVKLYETRVYTNRLVDSTKISGTGKFRFKSQIRTSGFYYLRLNDSTRLNLILHPDDNVYVVANSLLKLDSINNSHDSKLLNDFLDSTHYSRLKLNKLISEYSVAIDEDKINIEHEYNKVLENQKKYSLQLVLENLASLACLNILYQEFPAGQLLFDKAKDIQYFKIVSDTLAKHYPNQPHVNALIDDYKTRLTTYKQNMILNSANVTELELYDINLPSVNNKTVSLLSLKDKYVLLHYWSAQDKTSIEVTPGYKPVYDKYKNKGFNVFCVNVGNSVETWKSVVRFEEYDWVNVCDTAFYSTPTRMVYNINQIPTNLLLDMENRQVLARNLSAVKLESFLEDALN